MKSPEIIVFLVYLTTSFLLTEVLTDSEQGFCEKSDETCGESFSELSQGKFIFYDVNQPEGFNLRRDVYMRFAIMLAEARKDKKKLNWSLVLPPWHNLFHWKNRVNKPLPWGHFFDLDSLRSYAPVVELYKVFGSKSLQIDRLYVLQNYRDAFEDGHFSEKFEIVDSKCQYKGFWGFNNITAKEIVCVRFQGMASKLWELVDLHQNDRNIMFAHGEIPLHDKYGTKQYWECRKSMKFNQKLVEIANKYIENSLNCFEPKCTTYLSIHWRRGDFARSRSQDVPSIEGTAQQVYKAIDKHNVDVKRVFIATDAWESEVKLLRKLLTTLNYTVYLYSPAVEELDAFGDGGEAIIEQIIASRATYFIGTHESTYSFRIQEEREILGFHSNTTFNRFCPDQGSCEEPSRWTIVN